MTLQSRFESMLSMMMPGLSSALSGARRTRACAMAALLAAALTACGPSPHETGLNWNGKPMRVAERQDAPTREALVTQGWEAVVNHPPARILRVEAGEWGDSLWLLEFRDEEQAYVAYQEVSPDVGSVILGETACGDRVCFRRGRWIGAVDSWSWKKGEWFARSLALPDAPVPDGLPAAFGSLLHQARIPGSERILTGTFMGAPVSVPVYAVKVDCRGDTAWVYAAPGLADDFAAALARVPGWQRDTVQESGQKVTLTWDTGELPPVFLRFSRKGMVGVEGCFDRDLTSFWLKMQARGLKKLK